MDSTQATSMSLNLLIGCTIGVSEAYVNHPLWALKTRMQQGKPLTLHPRILYRGVMAHAATSIPLDSIQTTACRVFLESDRLAFLPKGKRRLVAGLLGGCIGALISTPAEMIMTRQQDLQSGLSAACESLWREGKIRRLYAGFCGTTARDALFCCGFFAGVPILRSHLEQYHVATPLAVVVAGLLSGCFVAVISQPFDVMKTLVQSSSMTISNRYIIRQVYMRRGFLGFFSGLGLRVGRVASGIFILGALNDYLEKTLLGKQYS